MDIGAGLVVETLDRLSENSIKEQPQPFMENPKNAFKIFKEDLKIDWSKTAKEVYNFVRGMSPYPCAFTNINIGNAEKGLKIYSGKYEIKEHNRSFGEMDISKNEFKIYVKDGLYYPTEIQLEGKKRMNVKDFLNGLK